MPASKPSDPLYSIKNCEFVFRCPREWEQLEATEVFDERFCGMCKRVVYRCDNELLFELHVKAGHCVAVPDPSRKRYYLGNAKIGSDYEPSSPLTWD
ncbi:MAG: hypothetical protein ACRD8U_21200 [Pyrinomonadaceae bacterium]